jgi:uncharacterized membrane protein
VQSNNNLGPTIQLSRKAYSIGIIALGIQQLVRGDISANFLPDLFSHGTGYHLLVYTWGILFTLSGVAMLAGWRARSVALISGGVFLTLLVLVYCPYFLFFSSDGHSLIGWSAAIEESAFVGASFIMAGSYSADSDHSEIIRLLGKLARYGRIFFSIMLIGYGVDHFVYTKFVSEMVPSWIPGQYFWTYFTGTALIGAGIAIILKIKLRLVANLLGVMFFLWLILLHIHRAMIDPVGNDGLELARVFVIFGFIGIAFLMASSGKKDRRGR